jgi:copper chaperone CopZ
MLRRKVLQYLAISGAGSLAFEAKGSTMARTTTYMVKGFSCITCAVGLDALLGNQRGVLTSKSTYPEGKVTVRFDPETIDEKEIESVISELGFTISRSAVA